MYTAHENKLAMDANDDKRFILNDKNTTLVIGHMQFKI